MQNAFGNVLALLINHIYIRCMERTELPVSTGTDDEVISDFREGKRQAPGN
jgi:hypothetical protein